MRIQKQLFLQAEKFKDVLETQMVSFNKYLVTLPHIRSELSGSTAITALIDNEGQLTVANVGDSRCILGNMQDNKLQITCLSTDHTPYVPSEASRIIAKQVLPFACSSCTPKAGLGKKQLDIGMRSKIPSRISCLRLVGPIPPLVMNSLNSILKQGPALIFEAAASLHTLANAWSHLLQAILGLLQGRIKPYIFDGMAVGPKRVWLPHADSPGLSMTRAFGDQLGASVGVTSEPEIQQVGCKSNQDCCKYPWNAQLLQ